MFLRPQKFPLLPNGYCSGFNAVVLLLAQHYQAHPEDMPDALLACFTFSYSHTFKRQFIAEFTRSHHHMNDVISIWAEPIIKAIAHQEFSSKVDELGYEQFKVAVAYYVEHTKDEKFTSHFDTIFQSCSIYFKGIDESLHDKHLPNE